MRTRMRTAATAVGVLAIGATIAACGGSSSGNNGSTNPGGVNNGSGYITNVSGNINDANTGTPKPGGTFTGVIEKNITDWNTQTAAGDTEDFIYVEDGLLPCDGSPFCTMPNGTPFLNKYLLTSAKETSTSPETIVYKINPKAVWNDGQPVDAEDFIYNWEVNNPAMCKDCEAVSGGVGYSSIKSVTGAGNSPTSKTVTVTFAQPFHDWQALFALQPSHLVPTSTSNEKALANGFNNTLDHPAGGFPKWSMGPYEITKFVNNQYVQLAPNPKWYGAKPNFNSVIWRVITDATQEPTALQNKEVDMIYPQPEVDLFNQVKAIPTIKYQLESGSEWEHFDVNNDSPALKSQALRQAIFTAVSVKNIILRTVGQFDPGIKPLDNRFFFPGQPGYKDDITASGLGSGNVTKAKQILQQAGYKGIGTALKEPNGTPVPTLTLRYSLGNAIRQSECQQLANAMQQLGIKSNVASTDDLGGSLTHAKNLDYDIIVFAWVGTPFPLSGNYPLYTGPILGGNYSDIKNAQITSLLNSVKNSLSTSAIDTALDKIDNIVTQQAYTLPLYQKPNFMAYYPALLNARANAYSVAPEYNMPEWGYKNGTASAS